MKFVKRQMMCRFLQFYKFYYFLLFTAILGVSCQKSQPLQPDGRTKVALKPCTVSGTARTSLCGTVEVFEKRAAQSGRTISLNIVVLKAPTVGAKDDPVFYIVGGPGGAATRAIDRGIDNLFPNRDIVFVDVRGTGGSNDLSCKDVQADFPLDLNKLVETRFPLDFLADCRDALSAHADLRFYNTPMIVDDLNDVRQALGYQKINLYSISYGTRVAQVFLRRHPESIRSATLIGIAPVDMLVPLPYARDIQRAFEELLVLCENNAACRSAFPTLRAEVDSVAARLQRGNVTADVSHFQTGETVPVTLFPEVLGDALRNLLFTSVRYPSIPVMIHQAFQGEWQDWVDVYLNRVFVFGEFSIGMYMSVICTEDVSWITESQIAAMTDGTFLGDDLVRDMQAVCGVWPIGELPVGFHDLVRADVPVLLISGELDPATPPFHGDKIASGLSNSLHLVLPGAGHGPWTVPGGNECTEPIIAEFVKTASVQNLNTGCVETLSPPGFDLRGVSLRESKAAALR